MTPLPQRWWVGLFTALAFVALATPGCRTAASRQVASERAKAESEEDELYGRAEAYAHFAAGIVHELDGQPAGRMEGVGLPAPD